MVNQWIGFTTNYRGGAWVTQDGIAHTKISIYGGAWHNPCWANCWLGQGATVWNNCGGYTFTPVPCKKQQHLVGRSKLESSNVNWNGLTSTYLNLWGTFSEPTGTRNFDKFEIVVYLNRSRNCDFQNGLTRGVAVTNEGAYNRYVVQHRLPQDIGFGWTEYQVDVSTLFASMQSSFGVDLSKGVVTDLNVGNEACQGESQSAHDYLYYYVGD